MMLMMMIFLELQVLQTGVAIPSVILPPPVCAMTNSTVTLGCSFKPSNFTIIRVCWCKNHEICHGSTPTVYDSVKAKNKSRILYLGDKSRNCTLQIRDLLKQDEGIYRFRMEATDRKGHFTNTTGVELSVNDQTPLGIHASNGNETNSEMFEGQNVTLRCTAACTFHDLKVTWLRDDRTLSEISPILQISPLTAGDSGNYRCRLNNSSSSPYKLQVKATGQQFKLPLMLGVLLGGSVVLCGVIILVFIFKRKPAAVDAHHAAAAIEAEPQQYADIKGVFQASDDTEVSYAAIHFKHNSQARPVKSKDDVSVIYSSVRTG